jgi:hypothetical protein
MHDLLMKLSASMPLKTICINGEPYLERYYVDTDPDGTQHWLHRFLRNDSERHLHSHPWKATSRILAGCYKEERESGTRWIRAGDTNEIGPDTLHRIVKVAPDTWTYMRVDPARLPEWYFIDDEGTKTPMPTSEPEWWKSYPCRGDA